jgi:hypothetical protein
MKTFCPWRHKFPKIPHLTPAGSHVSSFLGRKAAQWQNENIYYRKAHNGTMKTFVPQGGTNSPKIPNLTPWGHMFLAF